MEDDCLWEKRRASASVNRSLGNHLQSRHLQLVVGSHWQGCTQQPTLPLAHLYEIYHRAPGSSALVVRRHERPICRHGQTPQLRVLHITDIASTPSSPTLANTSSWKGFQDTSCNYS